MSTTAERNLKNLALMYAAKEITKAELETLAKSLYMSQENDFIYLDSLPLHEYVSYMVRKNRAIDMRYYNIYINLSVLAIILVKSDDVNITKEYETNVHMIRIK